MKMPQAAPIMEMVIAKVMPSDAYMIAGVPSLQTPATDGVAETRGIHIISKAVQLRNSSLHYMAAIVREERCRRHSGARAAIPVTRRVGQTLVRDSPYRREPRLSHSVAQFAYTHASPTRGPLCPDLRLIIMFCRITSCL